MKKKFLEYGIGSTCAGVFLFVFSLYSSRLLTQADTYNPMMSQGLWLAQIAMIGAVILIGISAGLFILAVTKSERKSK